MNDGRIVHMRSSGKPTSRFGPPRAAANTERLLADISRLMEEKQFETMDEANAFLDELLKSGEPIPTPSDMSPVQHAQALIWEAWESTNRRERVKLAKAALAVSKDCADAYVILAEDSARSPEEAMQYYAEGVKAGERALGLESFDELHGHFWGTIETRPYMRARAGLAYVLWTIGRREEAIDHYREMLLLNPNDNQGVRNLLLLWLIIAAKYVEAEQLIRAYGDEVSATWLYTDALLMFRRYGPSRKTSKQLASAVDYNPHVPAYLLGEERLPRRLPDFIGFGDDNEAVDYVSEYASVWRQQEGALHWLRDVWNQWTSV